MKLFKKETGYTPNEYLIQKRVDHAKRLLIGAEETDWRVKDIAAMCGFKGPYYFSRIFKKRTGSAPSRLDTEHD